jgi:hypothetical protein
MRRIAIVGFHALVIAAGLWIAFRPMLASRFALLQTDPGDTLLNHYILEHTWKCVSDSEYVGLLWSPPCFYPQPITLAYSENLLGTAPIYWAYRLTIAELASFQLWMLTVSALTYVSMAWTLRRFGVSHLLTALGALAFAFGLPRVNQLCHQQLLPAMFMPPAVYFAWRLLESPSLSVFTALLCLLVLQLLTSIYLGWFLMISIGAFVVVGVLRNQTWRTQCLQFARERWPSITAMFLLGATAATTFLFPYVQSNRGFRRHYAEVAPMIPSARSWLSPPPSSWWADVLPSVEGPLAHEHHNFPGLALPVLLVAGLALSSFGRPGRNCPAAPAGPTLTTAVVLVIVSLAIADHSFWRYVHSYLPGAKAIRAVARIFTVVYLFAWIAALIPVDRWLRGRGRAGFAIAGVLLLVGAAEQYHPRLAAFDPAPFHAEVERLAKEMHGASAVYVEPERETHFWTSQLAAMWAGMKARVPVVNGYSGRTPKRYPDMAMIMSDHDVRNWVGAGRPEVRRVGPARLLAYRAAEFRPFQAIEQAKIMIPCPISPTKP